MSDTIETIETNHSKAGRYAFFAKRDAAFKHAMNASRWDDKTKLKADRVMQVLELLYSYQEVKLTNCKRHIRVKVFNPHPRDKASKAKLREYETYWAESGIVRVKTPQGIIYRVK
jgi:hypothetical protein